MAEAQKSRLTFAHVEEGATTARAGKNAGNPYLPEVATVKEIVQETPNIKSLRVTFDDAEVMENFSFAPGQVGQLGVFGVGESTSAITCGPPIMIKCVLQSLEKLQFADEQIYTTLEKRMKCGIGICGRCNLGPKYVCVDGPVFTMADLRELPDEL